MKNCTQSEAPISRKWKYYSGYGASMGKPSEANTYADIEAVYECLQTEYGVSQEDLVLYGQSVGRGRTLHLVAKLPRLRGVVLHSAILSGLRVLCRMKFRFCYDIYRVEQRYRRNHSQMHVGAALSEQAARPWSAKSYTTLALEMISKQLRCLKDAIAEQIKATGKSNEFA